MHRYTLYIIQKLLWSTLLITVCLTSIIWLTQALRFIDFMVNRGVSVGDFVHLTMLIVPSLLMLILPIALFCAVIFVYSRLSMDSELVVLANAGLSRWQVARPAIVVALLVMMISYSISLYFMPKTYREFKDMQSFLRDNYASMLLQEEVFNNPVDGLTVFLRERFRDGTLKGILVHDNRNMELPVTMMAEEGRMVQTTQGPRFILIDGNRQELKNNRLSVLHFDRYDLDLSFYTKKVTDRSRETTERYLPELFEGQYTTPEERSMMIAEGHQRITWPFYAMTLTLLGMAVLLSGEFNRRGQWQRISFTIGIGVIAVVGAMGVNAAASKHLAMSALMYVNEFLICLFSLYVLFGDSRVVPVRLGEGRA